MLVNNWLNHPFDRNSFLRVKLKENCELEGTDNAQG